MSRAPAVERGLLVAGVLVVVSAVVRFALSRDVAAPWIAPDEHLYGLLGRSLADGNGLTLLGEPTAYYSTLYPLLVGLPLLVTDVGTGVTAVQALQAILMSATAIPVYLWARAIAGPRWSLVAAVLTILVPGLAYSGLLMSEALYFPLATIVVWALATCLRDPSFGHQALVLAAVGLALATRLQAIAFVGVILVAVAVLAVAERSTTPFRRMAPTLGILAALGVVVLGVRLALGSGGQLVGAYAPLAEPGAYSLPAVLQSIARQTGAVTLLTVGIPLVALGVLAWETLRAREPDPGVRALVAASLAYLTVTVVMVGAFASRFVEHITERQLLSVAPPVFVAFAVWLHRGAPRPQPATSIMALAVAASALLLPIERVATRSAAADALSTIPLEQLRRQLAPETFEIVYALAAALLLAGAVLVPRRAAPVLACVVGLALAATSVIASRELEERSGVDRASAFAGQRTDWIDASGARDVTLLVTGDRTWTTSWHELFWNEAVTRVARLRGVESIGVVAQEVVTAAPDGRLLTSDSAELTARYVAGPRGAAIRGEPVTMLLPSDDEPGMVVWRTSGPVRLLQRVLGIRPNGDLHGEEAAEIEVFACGPGRLELTILAKQGLATRVLSNGMVIAERAVQPEEIWRPSVPAPPTADGSRTCVYRLETDGLIGSTRIEFVRD
ncbi:MAG: glycosyltransferase family 39 protein [Gaiellaceae bacterium]